MTADRHARYRKGQAAETLATWLLRLKGYRVLDRRIRLPGAEIDLVARRGGTLVFVEVKARATYPQAAEAISPAQKRRIVRAAAHYISGRPDLAALTSRFDAILIGRSGLPRHVINAWTESGD